jgi:ATP-dependent Clp protease ATP-binding subunit ClpA
MPGHTSLDPTKTRRSAEHLANKLSHLVVGQDEAIQSIVSAYQAHAAGLSPVRRPIGNSCAYGFAKRATGAEFY